MVGIINNNTSIPYGARPTRRIIINANWTITMLRGLCVCVFGVACNSPAAAH